MSSAGRKVVMVHRLSNQYIQRINLLLLRGNNEKFHYTWIKNLNRKLYDQSKHRKRKNFCERYLHGYSREDLTRSQVRVSRNRAESGEGGYA